MSESLLQVGDSFPSGVVFSYIPYTDEKADITACGIPINYKASEEFAGKKVVLFSVPGAFTPGCSARHLPGYIENLQALKTKGVDIVIVVAYNDAFVMSAWAKANGVKNDDIIFASDAGTTFSQKLGWTVGERTARYALIIDDGKIVYAEKEQKPGDVSVSGAEAVLAKL
ncbi:Peroxiredoxin-2C [Dactylellina cionopaga]|nr:Peroxiredoxin-2C [Dactylellina cionopaga]